MMSKLLATFLFPKKSQSKSYFWIRDFAKSETSKVWHVSNHLVLVDPGVIGTTPVDDAIGEPEGDLLLGALNSVTSMDDVPGQNTSETSFSNKSENNTFALKI